MDTSGCAKIVRKITSETLAASTEADFTNFNLAGVLKNKSCTVMLVPSGQPAGPWSFTLPPSKEMEEPSSAPFWREDSVTLETAAMLESASPRKPMVSMPISESPLRIFPVACRINASDKSSGCIPEPLSTMRMSDSPPLAISTLMEPAPASRAFSTSSFTTEAGRSTTSPAAMRLLVDSSNNCIRILFDSVCL